MPGLLDRRRRLAAEIPTASMADIAFLLLIFFLTSTTIDTERGLRTQLPPIPGANTPPPDVSERNLLRILIESDGRVLIDGEATGHMPVRQAVERHILNHGRLPNLSESPNQAVVSIRTQRATRYVDYVRVLDEVWMAYREVWNGEARRQGYPDYAAYVADHGPRNNIQEAIPPNISVAEPDSTSLPPAHY